MPDEPPPSDRDVIVSAMLVIAHTTHAGRTDHERVAAAYARSPAVATPTPAPSRQAAHVIADALYRVGYFAPPVPVAPVEPLSPHYDPFLDESHCHLDLSMRAYNCLEKAGIMTVRQLIAQSPRSLLELNNLGETTLRLIVDQLALKGLKLMTPTG